MTIFELVKIALDDLYVQGLKEHGDKLDAVVKDKLDYLSGGYHKLTDKTRKPLDYKDPATRIAYVYRYVAAHADYMVQVLERAAYGCADNPLAGPNLRVTCIGGGPGSDLLAVLKRLSEHDDPIKKITCYLLDREQAWADTWTELDDSLAYAGNLKTNFQMLDVTEPESWRYQRNFIKADLFTLSFFVSEVYAIGGEQAAAFFSEVIADSKPGAYFLYVDNGYAQFNDFFDGICDAAGLVQIMADTNVKFTPRGVEQADSIKKYTDRLGGMPKLKSYLSYRLLRKPI